MLLMVCAPEPLSTVRPLPATLPLALVALSVRVLPATVTEPVAEVPVPVKLRLLMVKSAPSVVLKFVALLAVIYTLVVLTGI